MLKFGLIFACLTLCQGHAILPAVLPVPAAHSIHFAPVPYTLHNGFNGHEFRSHGIAAPLGHHLYKRSPHIVESYSHFAPIAHVGSVAHVAPIAHVAPVAVSHQERVDIRSSPTIIAAPIVPVIKPAITSYIPAAPVLHKSFGAHYGGGHYGSIHPHLDHY